MIVCPMCKHGFDRNVEKEAAYKKEVIDKLIEVLKNEK